MFKVNNKDIYWRRSGVFIVNFEHISHLVLVFLLSTLSRQIPAGNFGYLQYFKICSQQISTFVLNDLNHLLQSWGKIR